MQLSKAVLVRQFLFANLQSSLTPMVRGRAGVSMPLASTVEDFEALAVEREGGAAHLTPARSRATQTRSYLIAYGPPCHGGEQQEAAQRNAGRATRFLPDRTRASLSY
jgi:hypothetical protein